MKLGLAVAALLASAVLVLYLVGTGSVDFTKDFSASTWRDARAHDSEETEAGNDASNEVESQAGALVKERTVVGKSRDEVQVLLGKPDRTAPVRRLLIWDLGMIGDYMGPGDAGALYVQFDRAWRSATSARVARTF